MILSELFGIISRELIRARSWKKYCYAKLMFVYGNCEENLDLALRESCKILIKFIFDFLRPGIFKVFQDIDQYQ